MIDEEIASQIGQGTATMRASPIAQRLRQLRQRAGLTMREMATELGLKGPSGYRYYETESAFTRPFLPMEMAPALRKLLIGKGSPPVTASDVDALFGTTYEDTRGDNRATFTDLFNRIVEPARDSATRTIKRRLLIYMSSYLDKHPDIIRSNITYYQFLNLALMMHDLFLRSADEVMMKTPSTRASDPFAAEPDELNQDLFYMARLLIRHGIGTDAYTDLYDAKLGDGSGTS